MGLSEVILNNYQQDHLVYLLSNIPIPNGSLMAGFPVDGENQK